MAFSMSCGLIVFLSACSARLEALSAILSVYSSTSCFIFSTASGLLLLPLFFRVLLNGSLYRLISSDDILSFVNYTLAFIY